GDHFDGIDVAIAWGRDADGTLEAALARRGASHVVVAPSRPDPSQPEHVARHLLRTLKPLQVDGDGEQLDLPQIRIPGEVGALAEAELRASGLSNRPFVAIHPGSGSATKNWSADRYAEIVDTLGRRFGLASVVFGGPADADALVVLHDRPSGSPPEVVDRPLLIVSALLKRAAAFLGNDSGLAHLAGQLGLPTLALFGPSDPVVWAPLGPRVWVLRSTSLAALPTETVLAELESMLDE